MPAPAAIITKGAAELKGSLNAGWLTILNLSLLPGANPARYDEQKPVRVSLLGRLYCCSPTTRASCPGLKSGAEATLQTQQEADRDLLGEVC